MMKQILNFINKYKYQLLIIVVIILVFSLFIIKSFRPTTQFSGGSGISNQPVVTIKGWHKTNQFGVEIGSTTTLKQEQLIIQIITNNLNLDNNQTVELIIEDPIIGQYDKAQHVDRNSFLIKASQFNKIYEVIIDYQTDQIKIFDNNLLLEL